MRNTHCALLGCMLFLVAGNAAAETDDTIDVALMLSSGEQRTIFNETARRFEARHPGVAVEIHVFGEASYKNNLEEWLRNEQFEIMYWHAGQRLKRLVERGLVAPLDSRDNDEAWEQAFPDSILKTIRFDKRYYAVPYSYYPWGFFYHRGVFRDLDLQVPETWDEFLNVAETLRDAGITPFAIGSREPWPVAGWFDYLNLRINGAQYHRALLSGNIPFTDQGVTDVLEAWKTLLDRDYFIHGHRSLSWKAVLPLVYRRKAGMVLIGSFAGFEFPRSQRAETGFFGFPQINPSIPRAEEAPTDVFFLPAHASNNESARRFLDTLRQPGTQTRINTASGMLSPHRDAETRERLYVAESRALIRQSSELTQFLDRDAPEELATPALEILRDFMQDPHVAETQRRLEDVRRSAFDISGNE